MSARLTISKLDAAKRQIEIAIQLYFNELDPVSIHTLAAAAYNILRALAKTQGSSGMLIKDKLLDICKPELRSAIRAKINATENFFKHADRDPDAVLNFSSGQGELLLMDACDKYRELTSEYPALFKVFHAWYILKNPDLFNLPPGSEEVKNKLAKKYADFPRRQYFSEYLPVVLELENTDQSNTALKLGNADL